MWPNTALTTRGEKILEEKVARIPGNKEAKKQKGGVEMQDLVVLFDSITTGETAGKIPPLTFPRISLNFK